MLSRLGALLGLVLLAAVLWVAARILLHSQKDDVERLVTKHAYLDSIAALATADRPRPNLVLILFEGKVTQEMDGKRNETRAAIERDGAVEGVPSPLLHQKAVSQYQCHKMRVNGGRQMKNLPSTDLRTDVGHADRGSQV